MASLKILIDDSILPIRIGAQFLVCTAMPTRRRTCWWKAVKVFKSESRARKHYETMNQEYDIVHTGRALIVLSNPDLVLLDHDGCGVHNPAHDPSTI